MRLTAGLCPDQLGELQRSGDCTAIGESVLLLRDSEVERQGKGGEGIKRKREGEGKGIGMEREGREGEAIGSEE